MTEGRSKTCSDASLQYLLFFPPLPSIFLRFLLQKLKEEIAEVFAEIECFQHAQEKQEAENNPGEQTRQVG